MGAILFQFFRLVYRRCCCIFSALLQEKKFTDWDGSETDFAVKVTRWIYTNDSGQLGKSKESQEEITLEVEV